MSPQIELKVADGTAMAAYVARPASTARQAVLVLQEAFGVNAHIRDVADRLAKEGYLALAPELFHRTGPGFDGDYNNFNSCLPHMRALTAAGMQADLRAAYAWLQQPGIERTVAVGFCMGGRAAVRAAATVPLQAAASFYGSGLPALRAEVPSVRGKLLLIWGDRDQHILPAQRREWKDLLRAEKKDFVECTFSEAGHGFFCEQRRDYDAFSARLAWAVLLPFLAGQ